MLKQKHIRKAKSPERKQQHAHKVQKPPKRKVCTTAITTASPTLTPVISAVSALQHDSLDLGSSSSAPFNIQVRHYSRDNNNQRDGDNRRSYRGGRGGGGGGGSRGGDGGRRDYGGNGQQRYNNNNNNNRCSVPTSSFIDNTENQFLNDVAADPLPNADIPQEQRRRGGGGRNDAQPYEFRESARYIKVNNNDVQQFTTEEIFSKVSLLTLKNYNKYKELARSVTSGDRAQVYQWLSNKDNRLAVDVGSPDTYGSTLVAQAAKKHFYGVLLTLLPFVDVNQSTGHQGPAIFYSLAVADLYIMRALLDYGADPNMRGPGDQTPLMVASCIDNPSFIQYLLLKGAELNLKDAKGRTALMYAVKKCSPQIGKYLYQCGANPFITDNAGKSAYDYAIERSNDTNLDPIERKNALHLANVFKQPPEIIRLLPTQETKLEIAAQHNDPSFIPNPVNYGDVLKEYNTLIESQDGDAESITFLPDGKMFTPNDPLTPQYKKQILHSYQRVLQSFYDVTKDEIRKVGGNNYNDSNNNNSNNNNNTTSKQSNDDNALANTNQDDIIDVRDTTPIINKNDNNHFDPHHFLHRVNSLLKVTKTPHFDPTAPGASPRFGLDGELKPFPQGNMGFGNAVSKWGAKKAVTTVYQDILARNDFTLRHTEHVDPRYKEWYTICRTIHIQEQQTKEELKEELKYQSYVLPNGRVLVADQRTDDFQAYQYLGLPLDGLPRESYYDRVGKFERRIT